ncbi:fatty-acid--CoA ligase [Cupriavidus sp. IDO]|nr:fatty-acid--CoA ligase [Cupriavidus sp. IDO]
MGMSLTQPLHKALRQCPQAEALVSGQRRSTFAVLCDRVARLAAALQRLGMRPGDRVGMLAQNSDRYVEYLYGAWWGGGVVNPVNVRWTAREMVWSLDDCGTRILLVDDAFARIARDLRALSKSLQTLIHVGDGPVPSGMLGYEWLLAETEPVRDAQRGGADLAAILYTGGTTGTPKGVMLTHANLAIDALAAVAAATRPERAVGIQAAPMFHVGGIGLTLQLMLRLCKQVILPGFDEAAVLRAISEERGSEIFLVPTMIQRLLDAPEFGAHDLSSLSLVLYGAAPIDSPLLDRALAAMPQARFAQLYGMTELSPVVSCLPAWCHAGHGREAGKLRSAGLPVPVAEVRIVDGDGREVPRGTVGEVTVRGPTVMAGYWNNPEQSAIAVRDGWMHTGDAAWMDDDGFLYIVDRVKDMIVTGGENVYSAEVENTLAKHPAVSACAVIGIPNEKWGESVHAVVVCKPCESVSETELIAHCKAEIAGYKSPRSIEFRDALPLSGAGKVLKIELRKPFWEGRARQIG